MAPSSPSGAIRLGRDGTPLRPGPRSVVRWRSWPGSRGYPELVPGAPYGADGVAHVCGAEGPCCGVRRLRSAFPPHVGGRVVGARAAVDADAAILLYP